MISKINRITNFGIFQNYLHEEVKPFNTHNLLYGWNGSGKTTLGRMLSSIEQGKIHESFPDSKFEIEREDGTKINEKFTTHLNIKCFNNDFIKKNIDLDSASTEPIVYISEEKVTEKNSLFNLQEKLRLKQVELQDKVDDKKSNESFINDFHKECGKAIKDFLLGTIHANVTYNKSTSERILNRIRTDEEINSLDGLIMNDSDIEILKSRIILQSKKDPVLLDVKPYNIDRIKHQSIDVFNILSKNITSSALKRLESNKDINVWVKEGFEIHKNHNSNKCEFCDQQLPPQRMADIESHFSDEYIATIKQIDSVVSALELLFKPMLVNNSHQFYPELQVPYEQCINLLNTHAKTANDLIKKWLDQLQNKRENPFNWHGEVISDIQPFSRYNTEAENLKFILHKHNSTSKNYNELAQEAKTKIEEHFVAQRAVTEEMNIKEGRLLALNEMILEIEKVDIPTIKQDIASIEQKLKNDIIAIEVFNTNLHKFIGRSNITLERNPNGGYFLKRNGILAQNLSEGEKTAITLIYFVSKLRENGNKIEDSIIVFDDPISSFDSNHLFNASNFITNNCSNAKQLFILTHNFWFFKLVRDWMKQQTVKGKKKGKGWHAYEIKGALKNANKSLLDYNSEYHFVFEKLLQFSKSQSTSMEATWNFANAGRRVFEGFLSFKFPNTSSMYNLGEEAKKILPENKKNNVDLAYRFFNKYSHLDRVDFQENIVENIDGEGVQIAKALLEIVQEIDPHHYESMVNLCISN